ncbi:MAG: NAD(P)/FAD-dependent oxidoreductase [Acidimicrobiia bacterium]
MAVAEVAVVGGGPAGAAAAITLARAGRHVVLVDKAVFPRDKCCGDGLTAAALRMLEELGLDPATVPSWHVVDDIVMRSPSGYSVTLPLPRGQGLYAAVARRADLDAALLDVARGAGVEVLDGQACTGAEARADRIVLGVEGLGSLHAWYAIGADGMWSPLRKALGAGEAGYLGEWHAFRQYFHNVSTAAGRDLFVWFEPDLLPGYAWSFPLPGGRANVGFGIQRGGKVGRVQDMKDLWPELLARPHIAEVLGPDAQPEAPHRAWPIPARVEQVALSSGRALFVGDAAAATDPLTGEGIAQALLTGIAAAEAIDAAGPDRPEQAAAAYGDALRRDLFPDDRMSRLLGHGIRHRKGVRLALRAAGANGFTRRNFARWLFEDEPRGIVFTPGRWHRQFLNRPGAYASDRTASV